VAVSYLQRRTVSGRSQPPEGYLLIFDLRTGQRRGVYDIPPGDTVMAFSPDGRLLLTRGDTPPNSYNRDETRVERVRSRVDLWRVPAAGSRLQHVAGIAPYTEYNNGLPDVHWAAITDDGESILTFGGVGDLIKWKLSDGTPQWIMACRSGFDAAVISSDGKYVAAWAAQDAGLVIVEIASGTAVARVADGRDAGRLAWSPDGTRLVSYSSGRLAVWDLSQKPIQRIYDFTLPKEQFERMPASDGRLNWCGTDHILLQRRYLVNLELGVIVWDYIPVQNACPITIVDDRYWAVTESLGGTLVGMSLPHPQARQAIEQFMANPGDALQVAPGMTVAIEMSLPAHVTQQLRESTLTALRQRLTQAQLKPVEGSEANNAPLRLVMSARQGETERVTLTARSSAADPVSRKCPFRRGSTGSNSSTSAAGKPPGHASTPWAEPRRALSS